MSCPDFRIQVSEAVDGWLTDAEAVPLRAHLRECASCRRFDREQRELASLLRQADPDLAPPARIWEQIERRIQAQDRAPQLRRWAPGRLMELFSLPQWGYAMAALALAAALSITVFQSDNSGDMERMLAELDAYQPEVRRNPWLSGPVESNPFLQVAHGQSRNAFGDFLE